MHHFPICLFSSISTVSYMDELGHHDDNARMAITMENTYQMGEITFTLMTNPLHYSIITIHRLCTNEFIFYYIFLYSKCFASNYQSVICVISLLVWEHVNSVWCNITNLMNSSFSITALCFPCFSQYMKIILTLLTKAVTQFYSLMILFLLFGPQDPANASLSLLSKTYWKMYSPVISNKRNTK